ncbi:MAG: 4-(cytidine 5'-diphospho)-2-C-methyl-D-erythritol kinase [Clostridia bacterium]|nr:4-(cytidine 5'-diphospho)-2-C-methyl-D-erythritol kinase [Clostridia bacterium]
MRVERANAKINLYLNVVGRRENGYHDIVSVMQTVSLCDLVTVDFAPAEHTSICLQSSGNVEMPTDCRNLAWRAAEKFLQATGRRGEVRIILEKHIPMAAGLAGGSADAAAVLRALNALCCNPLTVDELCTLGASLGADVPFCIRGGSALVGGIGERMEDFPAMPQCFLVVACRGEGVSTPWAYGELDQKYSGFVEPAAADSEPEQIRTCWERGALLDSCTHFFNLFEEVVPAVQKDVDALKAILQSASAVRAMMSGSGPSVFGVFACREDAESACLALRGSDAAAFVCHPCGKYPL